MPAAVAVPLITTAVSTGASIFQTASANKKAKQAMQDIQNYKRQDLKNPYEGLQVSTLGADRQREDLGRTMASYGNLAAMGGSRAIASMLPNLLQQQNAQEAQIAASLDEQEKQRQQLIAQGNSMVQQMEEQRENNDLLGMGNQLNNFEQQKAHGMNNLMQGLVQGGAAIAQSGALNGMFGAAEGAGIKTVLPGASVEYAGMGQNATVPTLAQSVPMPNSPQIFNLQQHNFNKGSQFTTPNWLMGMNGQWRF